MVEPRGPVLLCAGREFHVRTVDGDEPPVLLMAGCGLAMEYWRPVRHRMAGRRVILYDRPGMGGTAWPGTLPTLAQEVASLASLLEQLDAPKAVLVAHSMASFHAEALARMRPDLVSGIVMVDGSVEWYTKAPTPAYESLPHRLNMLLRAPSLGELGGLAWRLGTWLHSNRDFRALGHGRLPAIYRDADSLVMATAESIAYYRQAWDLLTLRPRRPWPGVPTIVLTAGRGGESIASQARYARLLGGEHVVVEHSKHLMMLDCPQVIADAATAVAAR